jgi:hypothetical protein
MMEVWLKPGQDLMALKRKIIPTIIINIKYLLTKYFKMIVE